MEKKGDYLFFLKYTSEGHYLILGGYQGVGHIKNNKLDFNVEDNVSKELLGKSIVEVEEMIEELN